MARLTGGYNPEKTIEALTKRQQRIPLTQKETGMAVGVLTGRTGPYTQQAVRDIERKAMRKLRAVLGETLGVEIEKAKEAK